MEKQKKTKRNKPPGFEPVSKGTFDRSVSHCAITGKPLRTKNGHAAGEMAGQNGTKKDVKSDPNATHFSHAGGFLQANRGS